MVVSSCCGGETFCIVVGFVLCVETAGAASSLIGAECVAPASTCVISVAKLLAFIDCMGKVVLKCRGCPPYNREVADMKKWD